MYLNIHTHDWVPLAPRKNIAYTCAGQDAGYKAFVNSESIEEVFGPTKMLTF